jgi:hypothetical protein
MLTPMSDTLCVRDEVFVGRVAELVTFRQALSGGPAAPVMLYLHGPTGIGKSALLRRFADEARATGRPVVPVDGLSIAARPEAFEAAAAEALEQDRALLLVDGFEQCQGLETWLRTRFLPRLPEHALIVAAGRRPLGPVWRSDPGWFSVLRMLTLGELPPQDADALLAAHGVAPALRPGVLAQVGGHPLALSLAGELAARDDNWRPSGDIAAALLKTLAGELPSPAYRLALALSAHLRTTTRELLRAALPGEDENALFEWLSALPFVQSCGRGLYPHELVRGALVTGLAGAGGPGYQELHRRVLRYLVERVRSGDEPLAVADAAQYITGVADRQRAFFTFGADGQVTEDTYRPEDRAALVTMAQQAEGADTARLVEFWLDRQPQNFAVYRSVGGAPVAFMARLGFARKRHDELAADPMLAGAWAHCGLAGPPAEGEHFSVVRFLVDPAAPRRPSPMMDLMLERCLVASLRERGLMRSYSVWSDPGYWRPLLANADYHPVAGEEHSFDGRRHALFAHDWRAAPLSRWVDNLPLAL